MQSLVNGAFLDPLIRRQAFLATRHCGRRNTACKCYSVLAWVKAHLHYIADPTGVESLSDPRLVAKAIHYGRQPFGDCDDFSMYTAALLKAIGLKPKFRVLGRGRFYHHVIVSCNGYNLDGTREEWDDISESTVRREYFQEV